MPLLDHFHPPLLGQRHGEGFHGWWAAALAENLNDHLLPPEYFAEFQVTLGARIEVDVAAFDESTESDNARQGASGTAVLARTWSPPAPAAVLPAVFPDDFEVQIFRSDTGPTLVAAIELISPGNKDREETRRAFAVKCAAYLQRGIGLIVVDIVTSRRANLHNELMDLLRTETGNTFPTSTWLYATAYRPAHRQERNEIDVWRESLAIGVHLPTLPLPIRGLGCLPIDLESAYMEARRRGRIG